MRRNWGGFTSKLKKGKSEREGQRTIKDREYVIGEKQAQGVVSDENVREGRTKWEKEGGKFEKRNGDGEKVKQNEQQDTRSCERRRGDVYGNGTNAGWDERRKVGEKTGNLMMWGGTRQKGGNAQKKFQER